MWGAIIQAIDHTMNRIQEGMEGGIKVADSQKGGAVDSSNATGSIANTSQAGDSLKNVVKSKFDVNKNDVSEKSSADGDEVKVVDDSNESTSESVISDERLKNARQCAENTIKKWHKK